MFQLSNWQQICWYLHGKKTSCVMFLCPTSKLSHVRDVEAPQSGCEREISPLWGISCFINPNRNSQWRTLKGNMCHNPTFRMRGSCCQRLRFNLGGLLKIITTTKVNNETLVSFSNCSSIYPHLRRCGNNTTDSVSSGSQLFHLLGHFSLLLGRQSISVRQQWLSEG